MIKLVFYGFLKIKVKLLSLLGQKKSSMLQDLRSIGIVDFTQIKQMHQQLGLLTQFTDPKGQYLYCLNCQSTY